METKKTMLPSLLIMVLLAFTLAAPILAQAGRGHHGHGHNHHRHGHNHHKQHHNHFNEYNYSQPRGYNRSYYPQPRYNYNYYPAPVYGPPPHRMMGIDTGNTSFMLRF